MSPRTVYLSRLIGLYCILAALSMITRKQSIVETVTALLHDASLMFLLGVVTLVAGLAMVLARNDWTGGGQAVIVTLVGWITLVKGVLFLFLPPEAEAELFLTKLHYEKLFYLYTGISLVIGIYLTYGGFASRSRA